ncbi:MAG: YceI family protein [Myxococcaceae bacterium]|nr:YceI family protein [Myxococcaceae bacterium]MCI0668981.1 YceI family protein [Myxococcaceae bacterium]
MSVKRNLRTAAFAIIFSGAALAGVQQTGGAHASFTGKGPAGFKLEGKTSELRVEEKGSAVVVAVPLAKLDTGIPLRDSHMKEKYLEVAKYPEAVLEVDRSRVTLPTDGQSAQGQATGKMSLHGQTKDVSFSYVIKRVGGAYQVEGKLPLNLKDYGINVPAYLGVTVQPDIQTAVAFSFKE